MIRSRREGVRPSWRLARPLAAAACLPVILAAGLAAFVRGPITMGSAPLPPSQPPSAERLRASVETLCGELHPRFHIPPSNLDRCADWIAGQLADTGLPVTEQAYEIAEGRFRNVIATREGSDPRRGLVIIGAHYDVCGPLPGADDNASGVAVLLELARTLAHTAPRATQMLVAFSNEEPPFFPTENMGSAHFARHLRSAGARVELMVSLDLVGFYSDEPGSQQFPLSAMRLIYPSRGNFIAVVGDLATGRSIRTVKRGLSCAGGLPVRSFRAPSWLPGVHWSDHLSFRRLGLPGVLVTDTAFYRNPNYHQPTDTPDTLDYGRMSALVTGLHGVLAEADRRGSARPDPNHS